MRRLLVAVGAAALLALPGSAAATITASSIDDPGVSFLDFQIGTNQTLTAHVTGTTSDKVDVSCGPDLFTNNNAGYAVATGGVVSLPLDDIDYYYCPLRVVPHGVAGPWGPEFAPRLLGILGYQQTTDTPGVTDWEQIASGPKGYADAGSLGNCAIFSTYTITSDYSYAGLFGCAGLPTADPTDTSHSSLRVNGNDAYLPGTSRAISTGAPAITNLAHTASATTGEVSASGSEGVVTCTGGDCTPAGVHVDHAFRTDHGQQLATLVDVWHNDGDAPADLDLRYAFGVGTSAQVEGPSGFVGVADGTLPAPTGPGFLRVLSDPAAADGDPAGARGAIVFSTAPSAVSLVSDASPELGSQPAVVLRFTRSVAPGGTLRLTYGLATTIAQADADAAANDLLAATKPSIAITSPDDGATTGPGSVTVKGTSSDDGGPPAVNVNGVAATVASDGTWSVDVPLPTDPTTLTATATDADGNTATASRTVHKAIPPVVPAATPPSVKNVKVKVAKNGTITVTATVNEAGSLSAKLTGKLAKRTKTLAHAKKTAKAAGKVTLKLKLSKAARKQLRKRGLKTKLALTFTANGKSANATKTVKLKKLKR